ncbi:MAG: helix-turn-helix domain-containing protein [Verrucomicrobiota bacterium]
MKKILQNNSPKNRAQTVAQRRHETLRRFERLKRNRSAAKAAALVGLSVPTLWRWRKKFNARGLSALEPRTFKCGRRSPFTKIRLSTKAVRALELLLVEKNSPRAAWVQFANFDPGCPPLLAAHVQRYGRAPARFAGIGRVSSVRARCYVSEDGRRLFVKLPCTGTLTAELAVPPKFRFIKLKTA